MKVDIQYFWKEKEYVRLLLWDMLGQNVVIRFKDGGT